MKKFIYSIFIILISVSIIKLGYTYLSFAYSPISEKSKITKSPTMSSQINNTYSKSDNTASERTSELYALPTIITSKSQWIEAIDYCVDNLYKDITFEIHDFDNNIYDIKNLNLINVSIKAEGSVKSDKKATITYIFTYKENYILNKAAKNKKYITELTTEQLKLFNKIKKIASEITNKNMTDFEKEKAIHNYIVLNSSYSKNITDNSYNIRNLIENKTGVCEAYAYTFQILCTFAGLECDVITGTLNGQNHGWNLIKLDGEYYHVDVTSDDPIPDKKNRILYGFLNLTDNEIAKTHKWNRDDFPKCTASKYNYYIYNNLIVETPEQMRNLVLKGLSEGKTEIYFYVKNFVITGKNDFQFCVNSNRSINSYSLIGDIGSDGEFVFIPSYN